MLQQLEQSAPLLGEASRRVSYQALEKSGSGGDGGGGGGCTARFVALLGSSGGKIVLDWGGFVAFYALETRRAFTFAACAACAVQLFCMSLTHLRSVHARRNSGGSGGSGGRIHRVMVVSPKDFDLGFTLTFAALAAASASCAAAPAVLQLWANALVNLAMAAIALAGAARGRGGFVVDYALEGGMPPRMARDPTMRAVLGEATAEWGLVFLGMGGACAVAPLYRSAGGGGGGGGGGGPHTRRTYAILDAVFTYALQYALLLWALLRSTVLQPRQSRARAAWLRRSPEQYAAAHGFGLPGAAAAAR